MNLTEQKRLLEKRRSDFEERFSQLYEQTSFWGYLCFRKADGGIFSLCSFPNDLALVIEHAENQQEAELNRFEDGDLFYLEDMDEETMFQAMLREIEG